MNEQGRRIGQDHPRAELTDREVELMRDLHEDPINPLGYRRLARKFEVSITLAKKICRYKIRAQTATRFKRGT